MFDRDNYLGQQLGIILWWKNLVVGSSALCIVLKTSSLQSALLRLN